MKMIEPNDKEKIETLKYVIRDQRKALVLLLKTDGIEDYASNYQVALNAVNDIARRYKYSTISISHLRRYFNKAARDIVLSSEKEKLPTCQIDLDEYINSDQKECKKEITAHRMHIRELQKAVLFLSLKMKDEESNKVLMKAGLIRINDIASEFKIEPIKNSAACRMIKSFCTKILRESEKFEAQAERE